MTARTTPCVFCELAERELVWQSPLVVALRDGFPVSPGHTLVLPRRHVATYFDATADEHAEIWRAVAAVKAALDAELQPDGYNVGFNAGPAAGQTVMHLHVHVIPRFRGDVNDPRGGVRHVIPAKANYLLSAAEDAVPYGTRAAVTSALDAARAQAWEVARSPLVRGAHHDQLLTRVTHHIERAEAVDVCVAFVLRSGVDLVEPVLVDLLERGGRLRLLTGDYLDATDPTALRRLLDLQAAAPNPEQLELSVYETRERGFHPKAYLFDFGAGQALAFVGSSNLSRAALIDSVEWNFRVISSADDKGISAIRSAFQQLLDDPATTRITHPWIDAYERRRTTPAPTLPTATPNEVVIEPPPSVPKPNEIQIEALDALDLTRSDGNSAGLVVLATGMGKTWLAAFDSAPFARVMFVAHRWEILAQAMATFRRVRPHATFGLFTGEDKDPHAEVVFASVQTLSRPEHLARFSPTEFDYLVVDEFHHADADTYRRLLAHFAPSFLLGLTATPERTDGGNLLALCQENLVFSCGLDEGIGRGLLCPFHYFGVPDAIDYDNIPWRSGRFDADELTRHVATQARAENALEQHRLHGGTRTIGFCCSKRHADFMASYFRDANIRAVSVHSGDTSAPRTESLQQLRDGAIDVIFAVDMFNEGVDVPAIDTVMLLRPTESRVLWLQQVGRGLRFEEGKTLHIIDYIGNHRTFLTPLQILMGIGADPWITRTTLKKLRKDGGEADLPNGCQVTYDLDAIDLLAGLAKISKKADAFGGWLEDFIALHDMRPTALEAYHEGFEPSSLPATLKPWFAALAKLGVLEEPARRILDSEPLATLCHVIQHTSMTRSYKMVLLIAWLEHDRFPAAIALADLVAAFTKVARRAGAVALDVSADLDDPEAMTTLVVKNPLAAWTSKTSTAADLLVYDGSHLRFAPDVPRADLPVLRAMVRELAEWRLAAHLYKRRLDRVTAVFDQDHHELDAHFTTERTSEGYAIIIESRGGTVGTKAARNTQYKEGLHILLDRLRALGATLERIDLATTQVSGAPIPLRHHSLPLPLADLPDTAPLRRDIQAGQGNNPTRRIKLILSTIPEPNPHRLHHHLAQGSSQSGRASTRE